MNTANFTQLIRAVTGRSFTLSERVTFRDFAPAGEQIWHEKTYFVGMELPLTGRTVGFDWKTPKSDEKMFRSFITAFTSKYREPDPATYVKDASGYGRKWSELSPEQREGAYGHHVSHMFSKEQLLNQVQARFECPEIETALNQWGFYETEYGIGIFCYWETQFVRNAIARMRAYLSGLNVPAREEYSDARWVYRFRMEVSREFHTATLQRFCLTPL